MVEIKKVNNKADFKKFVDFHNDLYRDEKNFVPYMRADELALRNPKKNAYSAEVDAEYFLAYKDGKLAGRIGALLHKQRNRIAKESKVRFTRFDCIDDTEVAKALFDAAEDFARRNGMDTVHGPMGFSDMDKEGMLTEGFDKMGTLVTLYNYGYYPKLLEECGYQKDVDWDEFLLKMPDEAYVNRIKSLGTKIMAKYKLHFAEGKNKRQYLKRHADKFFEIADASYAHLYGVVPYNEKVRKQLISSFSIMLRKDFICIVLDEEEKPVGCALIFPSIGEILRDCRGRFTPRAIIKLLKFTKNPTKVELGIIGVMPQYFGKGINAVLISRMLDVITSLGITQVESNPELENNTSVQSQWDGIDKTLIKRRRVYTKSIT